MAAWELIDWFTAVGFVLTFLGLGAAIHQIRKTKRAAEAAQEAAESARAVLRSSVFLVDLGKSTATLSELRTFIQAGLYEAALVRAHDLTKQLVYLRESSPSHADGFDFRGAITDVAVVRDALQRKVQDGRSRVDRLKALHTLAHWADELSGLTGLAAYANPEERT